MPTIDVRIASGTDDVEQRASSGSMSMDSSDLELVTDGTNVQIVGLRFLGIDIPQGAVITSAYIQFQTDEVTTAATSVVIRGQDIGEAAAFTTAAFNASSRVTTDASVAWTPSAWSTVGQAGLAQRTPDMTAVVQEIVSRSDWAALNDMVFLITGSGRRTAEAFESGAATAPLLHIEYAPAVPVVGNISINDVSLSEGNSGTSLLTFTVSRTGTASFSLDYATSDGSAAAGSDYDAIALTTLNFAEGETSKTISVTVNGDTDAETNETFSVNLSNAVGPGATIIDATGLGTITDDDTPPAVGNISINDVSISEGNSGTKLATFTVSRTGTAAFSVDYATSDGSASAGSDYTAIPLTTLNFAEGETTKTISVTINGDTTVEGDETFSVDLSNAVGPSGTILDGTGAGTIQNDDAAAVVGNISINDVSISEGNSGTKLATFTVSRTGTAAFSVDYATSNGSASAGSDYAGIALTTLNFAQGEASKTISVTINGDTVVEGDETFSVNLSNAVGLGAIITDGTGAGTIQNDDAAPVVNVRIASGTDDVEQGASSGSMSMSSSHLELVTDGTNVQIVGLRFLGIDIPQGAVITSAFIQFQTDEVTTAATSVVIRGQDIGEAAAFTTAAFNASSRVTTDASVAWTPSAWSTVGQAGLAQRTPDMTAVVQEIVSRSDWAALNDMVFLITGSGRRTAEAFESGAATAPLLHIEYAPAVPVVGNISINDVSLSEGNSGTSLLTFTVSRTGTASFSLDYATSDGSAAAGSDYDAIALTTLNFAEGETSKTISVTVNGDTDAETNETFSVNLSNAVGPGATIIDATGLGTITDDDTPPAVGNISINDVSISEGNSGTKLATFTVSRTGTAAFSVDYATSDGSASAGSDYTAIPLTNLNFAQGEVSKTISVTINGDTTVESDETFSVDLSNAVGPSGTILDGTGAGTIQNDDAAPVVGNISINDVSISEGNSGTKLATFTVSRTGTAAFSVDYATSNGSASAGSD